MQDVPASGSVCAAAEDEHSGLLESEATIACERSGTGVSGAVADGGDSVCVVGDVGSESETCTEYDGVGVVSGVVGESGSGESVVSADVEGAR